MKQPVHPIQTIAVALACLLALPALAGPGDEHGRGKGHGRGEGHEERADQERHPGARRVESVPIGGYFNDEHRKDVRRYFADQYGHGKACPPGLAKKHNGCMPPGQERKLAVGQPLPADVRMYPVPQPVVVQLPPAPYGYRYARVGNDIVLVRISGRIVIDVIASLFG